jgi:hypothetical protein
MTAEELISHSGKRYDLFVQEQVCGIELVSPVRQIPHRDLFEIHGLFSVETLAKPSAPERLLALNHVRRERRNQADRRWPEI